MKVSAILSALMTTALVAVVHAAPSKSPSGTDDDALQRLVVNYNHTTAAAIVAEYNDALYSKARSNAVKAAAPVVSKDILPTIYKNKQTCDVNGFRTLWVLTAHNKKDKHHAVTLPVSALPPAKTVTSSSLDGPSEFVFYISGKYDSDNPAVSGVGETTERWIADNEKRMLMYPYYDGASHWWTGAYQIGYRSRWRLASDREMKILRNELLKHAAINNQVSVVPPPNAATQWCAQGLIAVYNWGALISTPNTLPGTVAPHFETDAIRDECAHLVSKSFIRMTRVNVGGFIPVEIMIDNKAHAAVSIKADTNINAAYVRLALQESLRTGALLPVVVNPFQSDLIITVVADTIAVIGGPVAYQYHI
ncbi:hypothetical protein BGZ47_011219 [Haplosporangium gracile]|nr:hypothetical protein BGZ47_011219 [Haplosporangium gracile]